ncbi:MAG: hypothetical protein MGG11_22895 [Trichodesmium sp. MAG_R03]|nr:hypothetical protein [Trichodesmium sp. MAG_R03]
MNANEIEPDHKRTMNANEMTITAEHELKNANQPKQKVTPQKHYYYDYEELDELNLESVVGGLVVRGCCCCRCCKKSRVREKKEQLGAVNVGREEWWRRSLPPRTSLDFLVIKSNKAIANIFIN